ncbi:prohead protease/major capsid protein fusion protein [Bradyrhizobium sp. SZCCHNS2096]|uniref:prohead protease/major capsid protein fusion protein n=1 Tax=Bradyrhizobium sp. SZCCHNS2096 TaxID=3057309 RepID=UPI002916C91B|nr:prohead protease/major capsid protein fusion protein [Bradyrhizobium sp. SZCCHNS2096]
MEAHTASRQAPAATITHGRRAPARATSFDLETGNFSAVIATATPVLRQDYEGDYFEVLSLAPKSVRLDRMRSGVAPVLDSHRSGSARDQIGVVTDVRIEAGQLVANARLSQRDDVKGIATDLASGTPPNVSVGYRVYASVESVDPHGRRTVTHTDWEPYEMSLVAIPADPQTHVRHFRRKGVSMDATETDSRDNIDLDASLAVRSSDRGAPLSRAALSEMLLLTERHKMPTDFTRRHIAGGSTLEQFRTAVLEEVAARDSAVRVVGRTSYGDSTDQNFSNPEFLARSITDALVARMTAKPAEGAAAELMGRTMLDMGAMLVEARGERPNWRNREQLLSQIMTRSGGSLATSDFPNLLTSSGHRVLQSAYQISQTPLMQVAKRRSAVDFRALTTIKLSEAPRLAEVKEGGEVKRGPRAESAESFKVKTYARIVSLTRQAIINDDLGAFADSAAAFGRAAAQTEADLIASLLTANSGDGANLADNIPLYATSTNRLNKASSGGALSVTTLGAARQALRNMTDIDGKTFINVAPKFLVVGSALETQAEQLLHDISAVQVDNVNPFAGKLTLAVEPRLTGNAWRLFADPAQVPTVQVAYLNGHDGPLTETQLGWDVLGVEVRCILDFGCGVNDFRGTYLNPGQ